MKSIDVVIVTNGYGKLIGKKILFIDYINCLNSLCPLLTPANFELQRIIEFDDYLAGSFMLEILRNGLHCVTSKFICLDIIFHRVCCLFLA